MLKQMFYDHYRTIDLAFHEALTNGDPQKVKSLALKLHALVHPVCVSGGSEKTMADYVVEYMLAGHQNDLVPRQPWETDLHYAGTDRVPLVWQLWHTARIEDLVSNILLANQDQLFNDNWQKKIGSPITDTGNALEAGEAIQFGKAIRPEALCDYINEVGKNTRKIIAGLKDEELFEMVPEEWVMRIYEAGGVTPDLRSVWLLVFWGRLTRAGMLETPMTNHYMMHIPPCLDNLPIIPA